MGKSTTADMFRSQGLPVWDADTAVHELYVAGQPGAAAIAHLVPAAVTNAGVDRTRLAEAIQDDTALLPRIEAAIHPLVAADRTRFAELTPGDILVFDIPLLFETGGEREFDAVAVVSAPAQVQRARALSRPGMTTEKLAAILARQMPDAEKRARADYVIDTSKGLEAARAGVQSVIKDIRSRMNA